MNNVNFVEVVRANECNYLPQILELQEKVYANLDSQNKSHLFLKTSQQEICGYIHSPNSIVAVGKANDNVISVCCATLSHSANYSLALYIKNSQLYKEHILSSYALHTLMVTYASFLKAYSQLKKFKVINDDLIEQVREKVRNNDFFENDELRKLLSTIFATSNILNNEIYPWLTSDDIPELILPDNIVNLAKEYNEMISYFQYKYISLPESLPNEYLELSYNMVGQIDTCFCDPQYINLGYTSSLISWLIDKFINEVKISAVSVAVNLRNDVARHIFKSLGFNTFCTVERRRNASSDIMFKLV